MSDMTLDYTALIERLKESCTDWDGAQMVDGAEPMLILTCGELRELIAALASQAEEIARLRSAATDALAGWRYIRSVHGDLYGVGWDRVENALAEALAKAGGQS